MDVVLPQMGLEVSEGTVTAVLVAVGDTVAEGDTVVEVETDKAIAEVPATESGVISEVSVAVGDTVPVGAVLVRIGDTVDEPGRAVPSAGPAPEISPTVLGTSGSSAPRGAPISGSPTEETAAIAFANGEGPNGARKLRAAPIARRAAVEHGVSLELVTGTGPAGRITLGDVERFVEEGGGAPAVAATPAAVATPAASAPGGARFEALSATRQSIARRLSESQLVPSYTLSRDVDVSWLLAEKKRLTDSGPAKVGVVDLLLQVLAETLSRHPQLAASFVPAGDGEPPRLRHPEGIDLGLAVATDRGLLVPVLRSVHERPLAELVLERARLIETARAGRLGIAEMSGAAATLSSLGTFGVDRFTAMLNPGESSILAAGRTTDRVVPRDRGLAVVPSLTLTFTFDHRVVDGATGAAALAELADLLEGGMAWRT